VNPVRLIMFTTLAVLTLILGAGCTNDQNPKQATRSADSGFSFAAYGDSRTMMYLP